MIEYPSPNDSENDVNQHNYDQFNAQDSNQNNIELILLKVEEFLLPKSKRFDKKAFIEIHPRDKLDRLCYDVTVADHVRLYKSIHQDGNIEHSLIDNKDDMKSERIQLLIDKIFENRVRIHSLVNLCYGDESLESLKSKLDLIYTFTFKNQWPQLNEQIVLLQSKYNHLQSKLKYLEDRNQKFNSSKIASIKIKIVYETLRNHIKDNYGFVNRNFISELSGALSNCLSLIPPVHLSKYEYKNHDIEIQSLLDSLRVYFNLYENQQKLKAQLIEENKVFSNTNIFMTNDGSDKSNEDNNVTLDTKLMFYFPSWGNLINFFRNESDLLGCEVMEVWRNNLNLIILPQVKSVFQFVSNQCDMYLKGVCQSQQFVFNCMKIPACMNVLSCCGKFIKYFNSFKTEIPLLISSSSLEILPSMNENNVYTITYELPVTFEEILCQYVEEIDYSMNDLIKPQILSMLGLSHMHMGNSKDEDGNNNHSYNANTNNRLSRSLNEAKSIDSNYNNLNVAEDILHQSLKLFELMGLENSIVACDLYQYISDLMILRIKKIEQSKYQASKEIADKWMNSPESNERLKDILADLRKQYHQQHVVLIDKNDKSRIINNIKSNKKPTHIPGITPPKVHIDTSNNINKLLRDKNNLDLLKNKAKKILYDERMNELISNQDDKVKKIIEVSFRYLIRIYDIYEQYHGSFHIMNADICIRISSVRKFSREYEVAREWLSKSLRILTKLNVIETFGYFKYNVESDTKQDNQNKLSKDNQTNTNDNFKYFTVDFDSRRLNAYIQFKLSFVLFQQNYFDEGILLLTNSISYYIIFIQEALKVLNKSSCESQYKSTPISNKSYIYKDINILILLSSKLVLLRNKLEKYYDNIDIIESVTKLCEIAFGFDSAIASSQRKQVSNVIMPYTCSNINVVRWVFKIL